MMEVLKIKSNGTERILRIRKELLRQLTVRNSLRLDITIIALIYINYNSNDYFLVISRRIELRLPG